MSERTTALSQRGTQLARWLWREARRRRAALAQSAAVEEYLAAHPVRKLQIGAGHNLLSGWLNTDRDPNSGAVYLDAKKPLPFRSETFHYVFSEHLIEHLEYEEGFALLRECRRVLKPGGKLRTATPDLETILGLKSALPGTTAERYARWLAKSYFPGASGPAATYAVNQLFQGWGHRFLYDRETLRATLERAGFVEVAPREFGESGDEALRGIEGHGNASESEREMSRFETLVLEAVRP